MKKKEEVNNAIAFKTGNNRCHICNGIGHWARDCRNKTKKRKVYKNAKIVIELDMPRVIADREASQTRKTNVLFVKETIILITKFL